MASELHVDAIKHSGGTSAMTINSSGVVHISGHVIQTLQFSAGETSISNTNANTVINSTFTPKVSGSKFAVWLQIPNCTNTSGGDTQANVNIGTSATPASNTTVIYVMERMEGTGSEDVRGINGNDFGTFTCSSTGTHYISLVVTPSHGSQSLARHSNTIKIVLQEIAQ
jgi:hypothetical protein